MGIGVLGIGHRVLGIGHRVLGMWGAGHRASRRLSCIAARARASWRLTELPR